MANLLLDIPIFTGQNHLLLDLSDSPAYFAETAYTLHEHSFDRILVNACTYHFFFFQAMLEEVHVWRLSVPFRKGYHCVIV